MPQDEITRTLSLVKPDDLYPSWRLIDLLEETGRMGPEAKRWKEGIYGLVMRWGLKPDELI